MKQLIKIKEIIRKFVGRNEAYIVPIIKFLLVWLVMSDINSRLGFMTRITSKPLALIIALAGSFLPVNLTIVILALITLAHVFSLSIICAVVLFCVYLILFLIYFRFSSNEGIAVLLMPVLYKLNIPYILPISMGLVGTPSSMVSVASGVVVYNVLNFISVNSASLKMDGIDSSRLVEDFKKVVDGIVKNKEMITVAAAFAAVVLVVYLIRRLPVPYCWDIAIGLGGLAMIIVTPIAAKILGASVSMGSVFGGTIVAMLINVVMQFFIFNLDYDKTEKVQFEDDEYYYYVKAIPKNVIRPKKAKKSGPHVIVTNPEEVKRIAEEKEMEAKVEKALARKSATKSSSAASRTPSSRTPSRTASTRSTSTSAPKSSRGPLGLSGGRPAGEGRLKREMELEAKAKEKVIEPLSEDDLDQQ